MPAKDLNTEEKILEAAIKVFIRKGFDGARMQEIADEAGINKSLLHYYYRSKVKLFEAVFKEAFKDFLPKIGEIFNANKPLKYKIKVIVENYIDMLSANPHLPLFILHEVNRNPDMIIFFLKNQGINPQLLINQIEEESKSKLMRKVDAHHLIINLLSLCIFPFVARPVIEGFLFKKNKKLYDKFLSGRKKEITDFIINSIEKR